MRQFILKYSDDSISVVNVLDESSNEDIIAKCPKYQENVSYRDVAPEDIPEGHLDIREAWEDSQPGNQIDVSHAKAKSKCLEMLRKMRQPELDRLDGLKLRAEELNDPALSASIVADKTTLRNCTEDLKAVDGTGYNDDTLLQQIKDYCTLPAINN